MTSPSLVSCKPGANGRTLVADATGAETLADAQSVALLAQMKQTLLAVTPNRHAQEQDRHPRIAALAPQATEARQANGPLVFALKESWRAPLVSRATALPQPLLCGHLTSPKAGKQQRQCTLVAVLPLLLALTPTNSPDKASPHTQPSLSSD